MKKNYKRKNIKMKEKSRVRLSGLPVSLLSLPSLLSPQSPSIFFLQIFVLGERNGRSTFHFDDTSLWLRLTGATDGRTDWRPINSTPP